MAVVDKREEPAGTLAERFDRYKTEVEEIVARGIEHPRYELKREVSISRTSLGDRLDFIKLVQGVANAEQRRFQNVVNIGEFDTASVYQVLDKYLDPLPQFEVFKMRRQAVRTMY